MPQDASIDPGRFQSRCRSLGEQEDIFKGLREKYDEEASSVSGLRRRRQRASNTASNPIKTVSLIEQDGVLFWQDNIPVAPSPVVDIGLRRRRLRRRAGLPLPPTMDGDASCRKAQCY